jgi:hypothetical protein
MLTFVLSEDIAGLSDADVAFAPGTTGTQKGSLKKARGTGIYELAVTNIGKTGSVTLTISKAGYKITPPSRNTTVNAISVKDSGGFPWWILIILLIIAALVVIFRIIKNIASRRAGSRAVEETPPENTGSSKKKEEEKEEEEIDLPPEAIEMLRKKGLSQDGIKEISRQVSRPRPRSNGAWEGEPGRSTFRPNGFDEVCDMNIKYLEGGYKENLGCADYKKDLAELVDSEPARREEVIKNWRLLKEGKKGIDYINGAFIKNMNDFAYYRADVRPALGIAFYPAHRRGNEDPLGYGRPGRPGCLELGNLAIAIEKKKLSDTDRETARALAKKLYGQSPEYTNKDVEDFIDITKKIPQYFKDEMTFHEDQDGHTLYLVPSGKFHSGSGSDEGEGSGGLAHTGGHSLIEKAELILKNR